MADRQSSKSPVTEKSKRLPTRINSALFDRLCACKLLDRLDQNLTVGSDIELTEAQAQLYLNGCLLAAYLICLKELAQKNNKNFKVDIQKLKQLDFPANLGAQPQSQNLWRKLAAELDQIGVSLKEDQIKLLVQGDQSQVEQIIKNFETHAVVMFGQEVKTIDSLNFSQVDGVNLSEYLQLKDLRRAFSLLRKINDKRNVYVAHMNSEIEPTQTKNSLELILTTLSRALSVKPITAVGFLTNKNEFLIKSCEKGIKEGGFKPLINWYSEITTHSAHLAALLISEFDEFNDPKHLADSLSTLSCGLSSPRSELVELCFETIISVFKQFEEKSEKIQALVWAWFASEKGILPQVIDVVSEQSQFCSQLVKLTIALKYSRSRFKEIYTYSIRKLCTSRHDYLSLMIEVLPELKLQSQNLAEESGLVIELLDLSARQAESDGSHSINERILALTMMSDIWLNFPTLVDSQSQFNGVIFQLHSKAVQEKNQILRLQATVNMFRMLEEFSLFKNASAPLIYRALVYGVLSNPADEMIRNIIWKNFQQLYQTQPEVPITILLEPLLRQLNDLAVRNPTDFQVRGFDFVFFEYLARHPQLTSADGLGFMTFLSEVIFKHIDLSKVAVDIYLQMMYRFKDDDLIEKQLLDFAQQCQNRIFEIEQSETPPGDHRQKKGNGLAQRWLNHLPKEFVFMNGIQKQLIYLILSRLLYQANERVYSQLNEQIMSTQRKLWQTLKLKSKVIEAILHLNLGRASEISNQLMQSFADTALVPYGSSTASMFKFKATMVIQKIQKTLIEKEQQQKIEMEQSVMHYEKRKVNLKKQIDKRRKQLGVPAIGMGDTETVLIKQAQDVYPKGPSRSQVQWFDFEGEFEDEEKISLDLFQKRAGKLWQNVFAKYANAGIYRVNEAKLGTQLQFEQTKQRNESIFLPELIKMLRDFGITPKYFKKKEIQELVRLINLRNDSNTLTQLDYQGFLVFVEQAAMNIFSRSQSVRYFSPSSNLKQLVTFCYDATLDKGLSGVLFDGLVNKEEEEEEEMIAELTVRLEENQDFPLPAGYALITEKVETLQYYMPKQILPFVKQSTAQVAYILDEILFKAFNFHFLEPYVIYQEVTKVKKVFQKPKKELRSVDASHIVTPARPFGTDGQVRYYISPIAKVVLPPKMKLMVLDQDPAKQAMLEEVAETVELILQALERGTNDIYDAKPKQLLNKALQQQQEKELEWKKNEEKRERERKKRREQLKRQLEEQKQAAKAAQDMVQWRRDSAGKLQVVQASQVSNLKSRNDRSPDQKMTLPEIAPKKKIKFNFESQLYAPRVSSSVPPTKKYEAVQVTQSSQAMPEELKKLKLNVVSQVQKLQEQKHALVEKEREAQMKEQALKDAIRRKAERVLIANRDQRNMENQFQENLTEFMNQADVRTVFESYEKCLFGYFSFYCKQAKAQLGFDINFRLENLNLKEFIKFGHQSKVVPVLVPSEDLVQIFRTVARHQQDSQSSAIVNAGSSVADKNVIQFISFDSFKQALVRICVYGHDVLGGLSKQQVEYKNEVDQQKLQTDIKLKEYVKRKENERKYVTQQVLQEMRAEFDEKQKKAYEALNKKTIQQVHSQSDILEQQARDEQNFQRFQKQQENIGNGLQARVDQRLGTAVSTSLEITPFKGTTVAKLKNKYEKLEHDGLLNDKLSKDDIRDHAFRTKFQMDINLVSSETVETLFRYLGMEPGDVSQFDIDRIMNSQRKENTGVQPTLKVKRSKLAQISELTCEDGRSQFSDRHSPEKSALKPNSVLPAAIKPKLPVIAETGQNYKQKTNVKTSSNRPTSDLVNVASTQPSETKFMLRNESAGNGQIYQTEAVQSPSKLSAIRNSMLTVSSTKKPDPGQDSRDANLRRSEAQNSVQDESPRKSVRQSQDQQFNARKSQQKSISNDLMQRKSVSNAEPPEK